VFDDHKEPGGLLRYGIPDEKYDKSVLDAEIDVIHKMGVNFWMEKRLGRDMSLKEARAEYDAVILATGYTENNSAHKMELDVSRQGIVVNRKTLETSIPGVFAGGNALAEGRMAIRSLAHGKFMAKSINQMFRKMPVTGFERRFNSVMGRLMEGEGETFALQAGDGLPVLPEGGIEKGFTSEEAINESTRCFRCGCRKQVSCNLRIYADRYNGNQQRFKTGLREKIHLDLQHEMVFYESRKCIKCGLCVQIAEKSTEEFGLTFVGRGFDVKVAVPLNQSMTKGLTKVAQKCVQACPTAALALQNEFEEADHD
jgi:ferredoxin